MSESDTHNRMQRFVERHGPEHGVLHDEDSAPWLDVLEPAGLASFVAFCKVPLGSKGLRVYLRGQSSRHTTILPSLFRGPIDARVRKKRWGAYQRLLKVLPKSVKGTRFTRRNFGAVLQHYGFRTPWLDVVDDIHASVWFALHRRDNSSGKIEYLRTEADSGWVVVLAVPTGGCVQDLRENQSSRNIRCHVQQGFSLAMQWDNADKPEPNQDFAPSIVGTVRIPNAERWHLQGFRASQAYFFPSGVVDDTYRQLLSPDITAMTEQVELEHKLACGTLGRPERYSEVGT